MSAAEIERELIPILEKMIGMKIAPDDSLIESRLIDSMAVIDLTMELEEVFQIKIQAAEVRPENFETAKILSYFIASKQ